MSTFSLARGSRGVFAAWEAQGRIRAGAIEPMAEFRRVSGDSEKCRHPSIASNSGGEVLVAWIEGMWWSSKGTLAWSLSDSAGAPMESGRGEAEGLRPWSLVQAVALSDGSFRILK